jgi:hypothetical protein
MQFAVLGPLLVSGDGDGEIPLAAGRLRVLLAALVVRANRVVPVDELVEIVWDGIRRPRPTRRDRAADPRLTGALRRVTELLYGNESDEPLEGALNRLIPPSPQES